MIQRLLCSLRLFRTSSILKELILQAPLPLCKEKRVKQTECSKFRYSAGILNRNLHSSFSTPKVKKEKGTIVTATTSISIFRQRVNSFSAIVKTMSDQRMYVPTFLGSLIF